ncbi:MAG: radical SAM protein [Candidatus Kerfeldbacteria bacterium]|nr:radical SAM protein [Candidatus Kerfeldbacteria bacterium]
MDKQKCAGCAVGCVPFDSVPHLCHIETTYQCNSDCIFCYNPEREKPINTSLIDRVVRSVAASQIPHVYLIGGEPSMLGVEKLNEYIELLSDHSSVTIVTNGRITLRGISPRLACFGVPLHGATAEAHDFITRRPHSFDQALRSIDYYVGQGHDVRCIPVLTGYNAHEIYDIIRIAVEHGMESIFVDRYEDGGIGAQHSVNDPRLKPTMDQFRDAVTQMLRAREDFPQLGGRVGFGTAIPYCIDERLIREGMTANCGVGSTFCAINPSGDVRLCNQSQLVFGNVLLESLEAIWQQRSLDTFRDLSWVEEPCRSCPLLDECVCGCKVDANCSDRFCIDYAVRGLIKPPIDVSVIQPTATTEVSFPEAYRQFFVNRYTKILDRHPERFLVTRYQTVTLNDGALEVLRAIIDKRLLTEQSVITYFADEIPEPELRRAISLFIRAGALDETEVTHAGT